MRTTYVLTQIVDNSFRRGDQLSGSSGSLDGSGTRTMSDLPPSRWRRATTWSESTSVKVPGMAFVSIRGAISRDTTVQWSSKNPTAKETISHVGVTSEYKHRQPRTLYQECRFDHRITICTDWSIFAAFLPSGL